MISLLSLVPSRPQIERVQDCGKVAFRESRHAEPDGSPTCTVPSCASGMSTASFNCDRPVANVKSARLQRGGNVFSRFDIALKDDSVEGCPHGKTVDELRAAAAIWATASRN